MMQDLAMQILEILMNSIQAGARHILVKIRESRKDNVIEITVQDDGKGMSPELAARVSDPFTTTRKTRKVGMGVAFLKGMTEQCNGTFDIQSEVGIRVMPNGGDTFVRRFVAENPGVLKEVIAESVVYDGNRRTSASDCKYLTNYLNWCRNQGIYVRGIEYINTTAGAQEVLDYYEQQGWPEVYISKHKNLMGD